MSKLLPILILAMTFFYAHQRQEAGQTICGTCRLVRCKRSIRDNGKAEQLNGLFVLMFPPEEWGVPCTCLSSWGILWGADSS